MKRITTILLAAAALWALLAPDAKDRDVVEKRKSFVKKYMAQPEAARADACIGCKACLTKCPQHISIPQHMERIRDLAKKY